MDNSLTLTPQQEEWLRACPEFDHLNPPNWIFYLSEPDRLEFLWAMKRGRDHAIEMSRLADS